MNKVTLVTICLFFFNLNFSAKKDDNEAKNKSELIKFEEELKTKPWFKEFNTLNSEDKVKFIKYLIYNFVGQQTSNTSAYEKANKIQRTAGTEKNPIVSVINNFFKDEGIKLFMKPEEGKKFQNVIIPILEKIINTENPDSLKEIQSEKEYEIFKKWPNK